MADRLFRRNPADASSADYVEHLRQESRVIGPRLRRDLGPPYPKGEKELGTAMVSLC